jgi:hypothetical protein
MQQVPLVLVWAMPQAQVLILLPAQLVSAVPVRAQLVSFGRALEFLPQAALVSA